LQPFETLNTIPLVGKTITLSWYARAGANYSATSSLLGITLYGGTGTDENPRGAGYTGQTLPINTAVTLTTTWQRFSQTVTLASTITEITPMLYQDYVGTAGAADYFDFTGFQIDIGSVALPFRTYAATIQGELAACQRYYFRSTSDATTPVAIYANGTGTAATSGRFGIQLPVTMRTTPTSLDYANLGMSDSVNAATAVTVLALATNLTWNNVCGLNATTASGITTYRPYFLVANSSASAYVGLSAEL
jgi:hypothetical protein